MNQRYGKIVYDCEGGGGGIKPSQGGACAVTEMSKLSGQ